GGEMPKGDGFYYPATVLTHVKSGQAAYDDEIFGPVISLIHAKNEAEGIEIANDSRFGLGAAVFTKDIIHGEDIAANKLQAGACTVNINVASDPRLPFGGIKESGLGREMAPPGIHEFMNVKTVVVK
ncbi:MAG: aldehyde dehydrogenase family protein, partial [Gammaproteobacteria bacterium]|nr:aldehyde dehydrogenase family protein [Gammaproteobacteria bacterium]